VQEAEILNIIDSEAIDLVVLARYMQVLSPELCAALARCRINIHHSFLPSFWRPPRQLCVFHACGADRRDGTFRNP
jgi:formyltetrahydrofolate hydrolase